MNTSTDMTKFGGQELLQQVRDLCAAIERLPAGEHQTNLIMRVSDAAFALQQIQMTGNYFWPRYASPTLTIPELKENEIYAGAIIASDGTGHHIILLPGDHDEANHADSMEWAKSIGGDLPDRVELALLYKHLPDQFKKDWYWSGEQRAADSDYAWYQHFNNGYQGSSHKDNQLRARAVRRLEIQRGRPLADGPA